MFSLETIRIFVAEITMNCEMNEIGAIIKHRRQDLGVSQGTLSELAGVGINTLVSIERGIKPSLHSQIRSAGGVFLESV